MPLLLEELADETAATNRRIADRLGTETTDLPAALADLRVATRYALSQTSQQEEFLRDSVASLGKDPLAAWTIDLFRTLLQSLEACKSLVEAARAGWVAMHERGVPPERLDELDRGKERLAKLIREVKGAIKHRVEGWQPKDPERYAEGMRLTNEGKTITMDEARDRIRRAAP